MMEFVQPVQRIAEVGSIRVAVGCEGILAGPSKVDTAMVGSPANTISGSSSPMLIEGRGWNVAGRDPGSTMVGGSLIIGGSTILGGSIILGIDGSTIIGGSIILGTEGSMILGTGSTIDGTLMVGIEGEGKAALDLRGDCFTGEFDLDKLILPISPDKSPSLPSLISVTVDGNLLPVLCSYPSPAFGRGAAARNTGGAPIPLGIPLSRLLDAATTTGGLGKGRLLGELNPMPLSSDLTDDIVSDLSRDSIGVLGLEGPASGGAVWVRIGEGSGLDDEGRIGGSGAGFEGDGGAGRGSTGGGISRFVLGGGVAAGWS
jgi:hypothetical protein